METHKLNTYLTVYEDCTFEELQFLANENNFKENTFENNETLASWWLPNKTKNTYFVVNRNDKPKDNFTVFKVTKGTDLDDVTMGSSFIWLDCGRCRPEFKQKNITVDFDRFWKVMKTVMALDGNTSDEIAYVKERLLVAKSKNETFHTGPEHYYFRNGNVRIKGPMTKYYLLSYPELR